MIHIYRYVFSSICPNDGEVILYGLEIRSPQTIMVEAIKSACADHPKEFQEAIAADLHKRLGGELRLRARHQGVEILSIFGA